MERRFVLAVDRHWLLDAAGNEKRLDQGLFPIGSDIGTLNSAACPFLTFRRADGRIQAEESSIDFMKDAFYLRSSALCMHARGLSNDSTTMLLFFEGTQSAARCVFATAPLELWDVMASLDPPLRPAAFDLPPISITSVDADEIYSAMYELVAGGDAELFGTNAKRFLSTPHIIVPLFAHILALASKDNIDFPLLLRTVAEQLRSLLCDASLGPVRIRKVTRDHPGLWKEMLGERIAFTDGGVARISGVPSTEPLAIRVGIYAVVPGESNLTVREDWELTPYVLGDILQRVPGNEEPPDAKRLLEAARYVLEPMTALRYTERKGDVSFLFLHGPLVNQFTQYDEGEPSYLPGLTPAFLARFGFDEELVTSSIGGIPARLRVPLWNQFMAVYGALMKRVFESQVPVAGVVERTAGTWLTHAVLRVLVQERRITEAHEHRILTIVDQYQISDDFLFGCVLEEGEYLEPLTIAKNSVRRARDDWKEVVRQYPAPHATVIKTSADNFPFRVEMNTAGAAVSDRLLRLLYHTSRLLPGYAFPVGLDIVDKYASVPDWLAKGISSRITADVLKRALSTGDANIVTQVRQFLSRTPRDFFYRPPI